MSHTYWEESYSTRLCRTNGVWDPIQTAFSSGKNDHTRKKQDHIFHATNKKIQIPRQELDVLMCNDLAAPRVEEVVHLVESLDPLFAKYACKTSQVVFMHKSRQNWIARGERFVSDQRDSYVLFVLGTLIDTNKKLRSFYVSMTPSNDWTLIRDHVFAVVEKEIEATTIPCESVEIAEEMEVVVAGTSGGGVLFHEAIGHGLEQDIYKNGAFDKHEGKEVFPKNVVVWDDPTFEFSHGSYGFDHEGHPGKPTMLVGEGKIQETMKSYLVSEEDTNGHGRRENWKHYPLVRMSTTYLAAGSDTPEKIIKSIKKGLYLEKIGGGQVNVRSGEFVFQASRGRLIENGKLTKHISELSLKGDGVSVLKNISMIGSDLDLSPLGLALNGGTCGKGQRMPTSEMCPTFKTKLFVSA